MFSLFLVCSIFKQKNIRFYTTGCGAKGYDTNVWIFKTKNTQVNIMSPSLYLKALSKLYGACKPNIQVSTIVDSTVVHWSVSPLSVIVLCCIVRLPSRSFLSPVLSMTLYHRWVYSYYVFWKQSSIHFFITCPLIRLFFPTLHAVMTPVRSKMFKVISTQKSLNGNSSFFLFRICALQVLPAETRLKV